MYLNNITYNNKELITIINSTKLIFNDLQFTNMNCPYCNGIIMIK